MRTEIARLILDDDARDVTLIQALRKFHRETDCGDAGLHWVECERLCDVFGYANFEAWDIADRARYEASLLLAEETQ